MARRNLFLVIILPVGVISLVCSGVIIRANIIQREKEKEIEAAAKAFESETQGVIQKVAARQSVNDSMAATTINLSPYTNRSLTQSFIPRKNNKHDLQELPTGTHTFGGIPFNITGEIQLFGNGLNVSHANFPKQVNGIRIGEKCNKIHLFHGASFVTPNQMGETIARIVLHYKDGSKEALDIVSGQNVLDWCGPADINSVKDPKSELAWLGRNPFIQSQWPDYFLRLYKSTYDNPQPDIEITTIDYEWAKVSAASFLVGLTIE